jgi:hypothetical protein
MEITRNRGRRRGQPGDVGDHVTDAEYAAPPPIDAHAI